MISFLITAGPTREYLDPVRFISNASSGLMGYALAGAARRKKHSVTLVSGPVSLARPKGVTTIPVVSADEMLCAVKRAMKTADVFISAAAVADYRPARYRRHKIKKSSRAMTLKLMRTDDILRSAGRMRKDAVLVGFALESRNLIAGAKKKLKEKGLDLIVANTPAAIGKRASSAWLIDREGVVTALKGREKTKLAEKIIDEAFRIWKDRQAGEGAR